MRARRTAFTRLETILTAWLRAGLSYLRPRPVRQGRERRRLDRAPADGEARIKKQLDIIAHPGLLGADPTRAKTVLSAMLSAERERYREMVLHPNSR